MIFTADFETVNKIDDCRIWSYGLCEVGNHTNFIYGYTMEDFFNFLMKSKENHTLYFHNLKFDCDFIFYYLYRNKYKHVRDSKDASSKTFTTLISDKGDFYSVTIYFKKQGKKTKKVTLLDSQKLINRSVKDIAKDFKLPIRKGEIDYNKERPIGYIPTEDEIEYLKNDVEIMARVLDIMFKRGLTKMTIASNALMNYKETIGEKTWEINYPKPSYDEDVRKSYKGGWCYLNPRFKNKIIEEGIVFDVNSLYPSVMRYSYLPIGEGIYYKGKYKKDKLYPLYVQKLFCQFELKEGYLPTIQLKADTRFCGTEYLENSKDDFGVLQEVELHLTSVDLKLFFEHYNVYNVTYVCGYKFKQSNQMFNKYIDYWVEQKNSGKANKNASDVAIAKLMLNALYGRFALNPIVRSKIPIYDSENDFVKFKQTEKEYREPVYIPMGSFITAYAREKTIRSAQKVYDRFIYADTDSLHLKGFEIPEELDIDPYKLGAWDFEFKFDKGKFLRQKCYMEYGKNPTKDEDKYTKITCAGMPEKCYEYVNFDNFDFNSKFKGRLEKKRVSGGTVLTEEFYTIKKGI